MRNNYRAEEQASIAERRQCPRWNLPRPQAKAALAIVWGLQANLFASIIHSKDLSHLQMSMHLLVQEAGKTSRQGERWRQSPEQPIWDTVNHFA